MTKGECVLTALTVTELAYSTNFFHKKCVPHDHKMHIPQEEEEESYICHMFSAHKIVPLTWLWMILNSHNILNYGISVNASNCITL